MAAPDWIEHVDFPNTSYGARSSPLTPAERAFLEGRERARTIAESQDPNACYSYDDWALCELDGTYYVFMTAGCSCPSPNETWMLMKTGDLEEILDYLQPSTSQSDEHNYDRSHEAFFELLRQVEKAGWTLRKPAPERGKGDW